MTDRENPWYGMQDSKGRRVDNESRHDIFWIVDLEGRYGFSLHSRNPFEDNALSVSLNGISLIKRNDADNRGKLFLFLENHEDWQIFKILCNDLISITHLHEDDLDMIKAVEIRLKRWQQLLRARRKDELSLEQQMGLFSELSCLLDIVMTHTSKYQSVLSWVGPDFDKQDFLLENEILEIKSHRTSRAAKVTISSADQLYTTREPIYLIVYSLAPAEHGKTILQLVEQIRKMLVNEANETQAIFEQKLLDYGFIPEINTLPLHGFLIDSIAAYAVTKEFPKITPAQISPAISSVKYSIELASCGQFAVDIHQVLKKSVL